MAGLPPLRVAAASAETPISAKQARRNARAAKRADREVRKRGKAAAKKRREREIKERQWQSRKLREDNKSVATQRVQRMYNDEYRPWVNGGAAVAHPRLPHGPGNIEMRTARGSDPETMLFTLLSKRAETTHPALQGYTALRSTCDVHKVNPIWHGRSQMAVTVPPVRVGPKWRHSAAGLVRAYVKDSAAEMRYQRWQRRQQRIAEEDYDPDDDSENSLSDSLSDLGNDDDEGNVDASSSASSTAPTITTATLSSATSTPILWHYARAPFTAHSAFAQRPPSHTSLRDACPVHLITPVVWGVDLTRIPLPSPIQQPASAASMHDSNHDHSHRDNDVHVELPPGPLECPVCKAQPGRLGRSGCPCCWRNPCGTLPWTFPQRTMPGVEQGFSVSNLQFQEMIRVRKSGDTRVAKAKGNKRDLPSVAGANVASGDLEAERVTRDLCMHTPFYSRSALTAHRVKHESNMLRIIIRSLPDDAVLVELVLCPNVCTLAHLNLLYVANTSDPTVGLCLEGRVSPLVLIVPTEEGCYHLDLRQEEPTDLHGYFNFSPGSSTFLSELRFGPKIVRPGRDPDTLLLLKVPVLSNIAVRQLLTVFLSVNTSMNIAPDSRAVRLIRGKQYDIHGNLPGDDLIQNYMTPLMLRKREVKREIRAQEEAAARAEAEALERVERAKREAKWKKARREKNRALLLMRQAAELAEKRAKEEKKKEAQRALEAKIAKKRREEARKLKDQARVLAASGSML